MSTERLPELEESSGVMVGHLTDRYIDLIRLLDPEPDEHGSDSRI
jgi:hypothetical protein